MSDNYTYLSDLILNEDNTLKDDVYEETLKLTHSILPDEYLTSPWVQLYRTSINAVAVKVIQMIDSIQQTDAFQHETLHKTVDISMISKSMSLHNMLHPQLSRDLVKLRDTLNDLPHMSPIMVSSYYIQQVITQHYDRETDTVLMKDNQTMMAQHLAHISQLFVMSALSIQLSKESLTDETVHEFQQQMTHYTDSLNDCLIATSDIYGESVTQYINKDYLYLLHNNYYLFINSHYLNAFVELDDNLRKETNMVHYYIKAMDNTLDILNTLMLSECIDGNPELNTTIDISLYTIINRIKYDDVHNYTPYDIIQQYDDISTVIIDDFDYLLELYNIRNKYN